MRRSAPVATLAVALALVPFAPATAGQCPAAELTGPMLAGYSPHPAAVGGAVRCGTLDRDLRQLVLGDVDLGAAPGDCSASTTNPTTDYDSTFTYYIPVVFHILALTDAGNPTCAHNEGATGHVSDALIRSQIDILNEDFQALAGTPGQNGYNARVKFFLASVDPSGNPTSGITRHCNSTWYSDGGSYFNTIAWDPFHYMNVYTNTAGGNLGYVPFLPADNNGAFVGQAFDRVVLLWDSVGRNAPGGPPYDQGRTATHEVGHYLGLEHTFTGGCAVGTNPACYSNGDLICDTNPEQNPWFGDCSGSPPQSCGVNRPRENFMDYSVDLCMDRFSNEQSHRMRCSLQFFRDELPAIFVDGFESEDTGEWSPI